MEKKPITKQCEKGHPMSQSTDAKTPNYKCELCGNEGMCAEGRICCTKCNYNFCNVCSSKGPEDFYFCKKGHALVFTKKSGYKCDNCKEKKAADTMRWYCRRCNYHICPTCRSDPNGPPDPTQEAVNAEQEAVPSTKVKPQSKKPGQKKEPAKVEEIIPEKGPVIEAICKKGHTMQWTDQQILVSKMRFPVAACDYCGTRKHCSYGFWTCSGCLYNLCSTCCTVPKPPLSGNMKCAKRHPLRWTAGNNPAVQPNCRKCKTPVDVTPGRWTCDACNYDLCLPCFNSQGGRRQAVAEKTPEVFNPIDPFLCWTLHGEYWDAKDYGASSVNCIRCNESIVCSDGRWRCGLCDYSYCESCKNPHEVKTIVTEV